MKTLGILSILIVLISGDHKRGVIDIIQTGEVKIVSGKAVSKNFAYCTAVIARFGDSAIYAHALPENYSREIALPLIWSGKIYNDGLVTSPNVIKRILNVTDSLEVDRNRLHFYIIAGCDERGLSEITPSLEHFKITPVMIRLDKTFAKTGEKRDIYFNSKTADLRICKHF